MWNCEVNMWRVMVCETKTRTQTVLFFLFALLWDVCVCIYLSYVPLVSDVLLRRCLWQTRSFLTATSAQCSVFRAIFTRFLIPVFFFKCQLKQHQKFWNLPDSIDALSEFKNSFCGCWIDLERMFLFVYFSSKNIETVLMGIHVPTVKNSFCSFLVTNHF